MNIPRRRFLQSNALLGSSLLLGGLVSKAGAGEKVPSISSDIWDAFKHRRSVRKFRPDPVPEADITKIIDAARLAPTSGNQQPWRFLVIRDPKKISQMRQGCLEKALERFDKSNDKSTTREQFGKSFDNRLAGYFSAPAYIIVLTDNKSQYPDYNHWDGPMAAGYLMLAARALGYGTVFITDVIPDAVTKAVLQIPDSYTRVCITPLGVPEEWPDSPAKKKLEEFIAFETL